VGQNQVHGSMLQFIDNTIFFCKADVKNIMTIKCVLKCFELVSGLKINFTKSKIVGLGVKDNVLHKFSEILNCSIMEVPFKYLGVPVGANHIKNNSHNV